jgi:predicted transcriptional regulator
MSIPGPRPTPIQQTQLNILKEQVLALINRGQLAESAVRTIAITAGLRNIEVDLLRQHFSQLGYAMSSPSTAPSITGRAQNSPHHASQGQRSASPKAPPVDVNKIRNVMVFVRRAARRDRLGEETWKDIVQKTRLTRKEAAALLANAVEEGLLTKAEIDKWTCAGTPVSAETPSPEKDKYAQSAQRQAVAPPFEEVESRPSLRRSRPLSGEAARKEAVKLYRAGTRIADIARELNGTSAYVRKLLDEAGVPASGRIESQAIVQAWEDANRNSAKAAEDLGISTATVRAHLHKAGVVPPRYREGSAYEAIVSLYSEHPSLTVAEASSELNVSLQTVRTHLNHARNRGDLPPKPGRAS